MDSSQITACIVVISCTSSLRIPIKLRHVLWFHGLVVSHMFINQNFIPNTFVLWCVLRSGCRRSIVLTGVSYTDTDSLFITWCLHELYYFTYMVKLLCMCGAGDMCVRQYTCVFRCIFDVSIQRGNQFPMLDLRGVVGGVFEVYTSVCPGDVRTHVITTKF